MLKNILLLLKLFLVYGGVLSVVLSVKDVHAHNLNFGTLTVSASNEAATDFDLVFQISGDQGKHINARVHPVEGCESLSRVTQQSDMIRLRENQTIRCNSPGLVGKKFLFSNLPMGANILVRALYKDRLIEEQLLQGTISHWIIGETTNSVSNSLVNYILLGIEHILKGWDHLLFLAMLMLLVSSRIQLLQVVTAFTVGHSITLAMATLGWISIPVPPTEALIALSIVFLAAEALRYYRTDKMTLTLKYPGLVSILFGLFHGLGFASVLSNIGVSEGQILPSLIGFNIGVELGQLLFISLSLLIVWLNRQYLKVSFISKNRVAYVGGTLGAFWLVERLAAF